MIYAVDFDGILCENKEDYGAENFYERRPIKKNVERVRKLYKEDNVIIIWTARKSSDLLVEEATIKWLHENGVPYHSLVMDKPFCDIYVDDKGTCGFPDDRSLYFYHLDISDTEYVIGCYLHNEKVASMDIPKLNDTYEITFNKNGKVTYARATGEFLRDKDLKEEGLELIRLSMESWKINISR